MAKGVKNKKKMTKKTKNKKVASLNLNKKKKLSKNNKKIANKQKSKPILKTKTKKLVKKTKNNKIVKNKKILSKKSPTKKKTIKKISKKTIVSVVRKRKLNLKKSLFPKNISSKDEGIKLKKHEKNPIMIPRPYSWESQAVFNPGAVVSRNKIHLFYRAIGNDGVSRIGYASSEDGLNFKERLFYPVYYLKDVEDMKKHWPFTSPARPFYDKALYASGGGWGGCEDPRAVLIDGKIYLTLNIFNGWNFMRVAVISIAESDLLNKKWKWDPLNYLSHPGDRQKNWVLFPEKIKGKFAIFHNLDKGDPNQVFVTYADKLHWPLMPTIKDAPDPQSLPDHLVAWHKRTRSAASPPIKTKDGWLLLYHAMDADGSNRYKLGAMLLDIEDPNKVICRSQRPILEPEKWYENDWKPGIIYANGSVVKDGKLFVYYGGGDKYIGVASIELKKLLNSMKKNIQVKLTKNKKIEI